MNDFILSLAVVVAVAVLVESCGKKSDFKRHMTEISYKYTSSDDITSKEDKQKNLVTMGSCIISQKTHVEICFNNDLLTDDSKLEFKHVFYHEFGHSLHRSMLPLVTSVYFAEIVAECFAQVMIGNSFQDAWEMGLEYSMNYTDGGGKDKKELEKEAFLICKYLCESKQIKKQAEAQYKHALRAF